MCRSRKPSPPSSSRRRTASARQRASLRPSVGPLRAGRCCRLGYSRLTSTSPCVICAPSGLKAKPEPRIETRATVSARLRACVSRGDDRDVGARQRTFGRSTMSQKRTPYPPCFAHKVRSAKLGLLMSAADSLRTFAASGSKAPFPKPAAGRRPASESAPSSPVGSAAQGILRG